MDRFLIPRPFDPRLIGKIAPAVAQAAMASGVATRPIEDFDAYRERLNQFVYHSGLIMKPVFDAAKQAPKRVVYADGEEERILRAAQVVVDEGIARPILIGSTSSNGESRKPPGPKLWYPPSMAMPIPRRARSAIACQVSGLNP